MTGPGSERVAVTSTRWHRKHASRLSRVRPGAELMLWAPHRASWWIAWLFAVGSLVGTLFFNATTFRGLTVALDNASYDRLVWQPDALGSICFLVSGYLAYVEVAGRRWAARHAPSKAPSWP